MIAVLGSPGSHSHRAAQALEEDDVLFCPTARAAADAVRSGQAKAALLPVENRHTGRITPVLTSVRGLREAESYWIEVRHVLAGHGSLSDIRVVRSHPQALQQCSRFLGLYAGMYGWELEEAADTASAAEGLGPGEAALCAVEKAEELGLEVLATDVMDDADNMTRFALFRK